MGNTSIYSNIKWLSQRFWLLIVLSMGLILFFGFGLQKYLNFATLQQNHLALQQWTATHYFQAAILFILFYVIAVAVSIPGAVFLTLTGGFLFGLLWGTLYVVFSATLGATLLYLAVRLALAERLGHLTSGKITAMSEGFQRNAFNYLLVLRLIPLFPFWLVNIVPALLNVPLKTFILATFIGIIPGSLVYVSIGNGLSSLFANNKTPNLGIIFTPTILIPLIGLAFLSLLPILYKKWKTRRTFHTQKAANQDRFD